MSAPDLTAEIMSEFADSGADRHITLLLGAGASTSSGLPGWDELAARLLVRSGSVPSADAANLLVKRQDPLLIAEAARQKSGDDWPDHVEDALYDGRTEFPVSALHVAAAGHLLDGTTSDTVLLTLNFDTLIEDAIRQGTVKSVEARTNAQAQASDYVVYHLHGVVAPGRTRDVVLTLSDFNDLLVDPDSWSVGLEPIVVEDFSDAAQIIRELRHIHKERYSPPQERARAVWDAHEQHFNVLQRRYSDRLAEEASSRSKAFGVEELNLTLWLADGEGNLARWASHDRYYRAASDLRHVQSGHDSQWIAGHALAAENILIKDLGSAGTRRWSAVLAVPIRVAHSRLPEFATAVISVGLPGEVADYETPSQPWLDPIMSSANTWGDRLINATFAEETSTLE